MLVAATPVPDAPDAGTRLAAAARTLRAVAAGAGLGAREAEILDCLSVLTRSWMQAQPGAPPLWSGLGADASGCDASLVLDGARREMRITAEAQGYPASPQTYWQAALRLSEEIETRYRADLSPLRAVQDLWTPLDPQAAGVLWHGAVFREDVPPWFKVYLHLMARGRRNAAELARASLARLGRAAAWDDVVARLSPGDEWLFLSLDLLPAPEARVKLYLRHGETTAADLDRMASSLDPEHAGQVETFVATLTGAADAPIRRGALTTLQVEPGSSEPSHVTTHLRLYPHCSTSDAVLAERLTRALARLGIPAGPCEAALAALAPGGLDGLEGLHGWASLQWLRGRPSVSVYLSPRIHFDRYGPIALDPERFWPSPVGVFQAAGASACAPR